MNYIGSKRKLSDFIIQEIQQKVPHLSDKIFAELFGGTGIIARRLKTKVKQVISNDVEFYSFVLLRNYIANCRPLPEAAERLAFLNRLKGIEGFIYQNYCSPAERFYFADENGKRIDAIRTQIEKWKTEISEDLYYFLLASLLEAADKVANTASVYGAFLKKIKKSAQKPLFLEAADFALSNNAQHKVHKSDANTLIRSIKGDILYLDPPYNARQYGANYHLLNTIAQYSPFEPKGKTGLPEYYKSDYCKKGKVAQTFEDLIRHANFSHIFVSYNNEGLMSLTQMQEIMEKYGKYTLAQRKWQRFKADTNQNRSHSAESTLEYLHILEKTTHAVQ
ncbi:MAG: DNA adenine methylase [Bernardetiaceae bacterium]|nr:DNA adenine methylase [Bernardetiaceae bacterium]